MVSSGPMMGARNDRRAHQSRAVSDTSNNLPKLTAAAIPNTPISKLHFASAADSASTARVGCGQHRTEAVENLLEGWNDPDQQRRSDDDREHQDRCRIGERRAYFRALRGSALTVVGDACEHVGKRA
jgi:hypothetical protein